MTTSRVINGRVAAEEDVHLGGAIFFIPDLRSVPYSFGRDLPVSVRVLSPTMATDFPLQEPWFKSSKQN